MSDEPQLYVDEPLFRETDWFSSHGDVILERRVLHNGHVSQYPLFFVGRWWFLSREELIKLADSVHAMMARTAGTFSMRHGHWVLTVVPRAARRLLKAAALVDNTVRDIPFGPYR